MHFIHSEVTLANVKWLTPIQTRQKLVTSLIVPQLLYCDVIFSKSSKIAWTPETRLLFMRQIHPWHFPLWAHIDLHQQNLEDMLHDQQNNQEWWTPVSVWRASVWSVQPFFFKSFSLSAQFECSCLLVLCSEYNLVEWPATGRQKRRKHGED
jgi:hypothetical protein